MANPNRRASNVAMEQILGNITAPIHHHHPDGQYIQLGFTPPPSPAKLPPGTWSCQNQVSPTAHQQSFQQYGMELPLSADARGGVYTLNHASQYGGAQPNTNAAYNSYNMHHGSAPGLHHPTPAEILSPYNSNCANPNYGGMFHHQNQSDLTFGSSPASYILNDLNSGAPGSQANNFFFLKDENNMSSNSLQQHQQQQQQQHQQPSMPNPTQLIENVVGNWVPNTNGTYSPFGNSLTYSENQLGDKLPNFEDCRSPGSEDIFRFNRDIKRPRMVAEVKPMRPTYSDVLTKTAPIGSPPLKTTFDDKSAEIKDSKVGKKENKRSSKGEKSQKGFKSNKLDGKVGSGGGGGTKAGDRSNSKEKPNPLHRRWASLDNMNGSGGGGGGSGSDINEEDQQRNLRKNKKNEESFSNNNKTSSKIGGFDKKDLSNLDFEDFEDDFEETSNEMVNVGRIVNRKSGAKINLKHKSNDTDRAHINKKIPHKGRKKENKIHCGMIGQKIKFYFPRWWSFVVNICLWLFNLVSDVCSLSVHLSRDAMTNLYKWLSVHWESLNVASAKLVERMKSIPWFKKTTSKKKEFAKEVPKNITMPTTGEEAMKRLLACKGKDPYSILGVTPDCTDEDIKRNYKKQAVLVHPDKNQQPGAEEAFKILVHAFHMIGESDKRAAYNKGVAESAQVEQAWTELTELLAQLQKKVETAATTIRCSACGLRHRRIKMDRPNYAARNCATCKIHHAAKEGDIWAEARCWGFLWHYYASMEGGVYDITEWAACQKESLKHLRPDSHQVQYRIALGKQTKQMRHSGGGGSGGASSRKNMRNPDLENLLSNLYGSSQESNNPMTKQRKTKKAK